MGDESYGGWNLEGMEPSLERVGTQRKMIPSLKAELEPVLLEKKWYYWIASLMLNLAMPVKKDFYMNTRFVVIYLSIISKWPPLSYNGNWPCTRRHNYP